MTSPACLSSVLSVGATNNSDVVAPFTNSNSSTDLMAPGVGVLSSAIGDSTFTASGTSMASPHAAGCAALLIASQEAVTPNQIEARLETSPVQVFNPKNGLTFPRIECALKPLIDVAASGPSTGLTGNEYPFIATVSPLIATQPISYSWQATGQSSLLNTGGLSDTVSFVWSTPGEKVISVTAENLAGSVSTVHTITIDAPLTGIDTVEVSGPISGLTAIEHSFIASVSPSTATQPISYSWQATGQSSLINTGGLSDTVSFVWGTPGEKVISVTAGNLAGSVPTVHTITITATATGIDTVDISGPTAGHTANEHAFIASVSPPTATLPITYTWQAAGQSPLSSTGGISDTVSFIWDTPGVKVISVTAENIGSEVSKTFSTIIGLRIYLPAILK